MVVIAFLLLVGAVYGFVPDEKESFVSNDLKRHQARSFQPLRYNDGRRPGEPVDFSECTNIKPVPVNLTVYSEYMPYSPIDNTFYKKYLHAYGLPVLGSEKVPNHIMRRVCYVVRFLFADRQDLRRNYYKWYGRFGVMAQSEVTTDIPEHSDMDSSYWDQRARGVGPTAQRPISTCAEENVGCFAYGIDRYWGQSIIVHEFSHGLHIFGWREGNRVPKLQKLLMQAYKIAKSLPAGKNGLGGYAANNEGEYFATGMQAYMNDNTNSGRDVTIHTREHLRQHDPDLYNLIRKVLPCNNRFLNRCQNITLHKKAEVYSEVTQQEFEDMMANQKLNMNCNLKKRPPVSCLVAEKNVPLTDTVDECSYYVCDKYGYVTGRYKYSCHQKQVNARVYVPEFGSAKRNITTWYNPLTGKCDRSSSSNCRYRTAAHIEKYTDAPDIPLSESIV